MEEEERVVSQVFECDCDDIPSAREPRRRVSYPPFGLEASLPEPLVCQGETGTAVVVLPIVDPNEASFLEHCAVLRHTVRNAREELRQVERGIGVMTDAE